MWLAWGKVGKESSWIYLEVSAQVNAKVRGAEEGKSLKGKTTSDGTG